MKGSMGCLTLGSSVLQAFHTLFLGFHGGNGRAASRESRGRAAVWPSGHRQDAAGAGGGAPYQLLPLGRGVSGEKERKKKQTCAIYTRAVIFVSSRFLARAGFSFCLF